MKLSPKGGWFQTQPQNSTKHYFNLDNLSLCKTWISSGRPRVQGSDDDSTNCPLCYKELLKLKEK
jgi:hypothetical protein